MKKTIEKIKGKGIKLSARIFGAMTACFSTIVAAYADVEDTEAGGVWSNIAAWIKKNKDGLSIVAYSSAYIHLYPLCITCLPTQHRYTLEGLNPSDFTEASDSYSLTKEEFLNDSIFLRL